MNPTQKIRTVIFYKDYFTDFFVKQTQKVRDKIIWTFDLIELIENVPETYLKHLEGSDKLYEIRVQSGNDIFRIVCFSMKEVWWFLPTGFKRKCKRLLNEKLKEL